MVQFAALQRKILSTSSTVSSATTSRASTPLLALTPPSDSTPLSDSEDEKEGERDPPVPMVVDAVNDTVIKIRTAFNHDHPENLKHELRGCNMKTIIKWTDEQRTFALQASTPETLEGLKTAVRFWQLTLMCTVRGTAGKSTEPANH